MNAPSSVHCSGCGRALGLEPFSDPDDLKCLHCAVPFDVFRGGPGTLRDCGRCGGQFVEHALVRDLIERREIYGVAAPRQTARRNPLEQPVRYVSCPVCRQLMNRKNFGASSGVVVDICHRHGIWFDAGELPSVLAFVESGGLAQTRRRELEELEKQRREAVNASFSAAPVVGPLVEAERSASTLADVAEVAVVLLDAVVTVIADALP